MAEIDTDQQIAGFVRMDGKALPAQRPTTLKPDDRADLAFNRTTTAEQAAAVLRQAILAGQFPPGTQLTEIRLSARLAVSRNTLREALRLLEHQGLVRHTAHHGVAVTALRSEDIQDIYRVRQHLEGAAVPAVINAPPEVLPALQSIIDQMRVALEEEDWARLVELDMGFHEAMVRQLGSPRFDYFFRTICLELRLALMLVDRAGGRETVIDEHDELLDAFRRKDETEARRLVAAHLKLSQKRIRRIP